MTATWLSNQVPPGSWAVRTKADRAIAGDNNPRGIVLRPDFARIAAAPDAERALRAFALISAGILERFADLNEVLSLAAAVDPAVAELWRVSEQERLTAATSIVGSVTAKGPLRDELAATEAADILWLLMAPDQYHRMTRNRGWPHEQWTRWYADTMVRLLLP